MKQLVFTLWGDDFSASILRQNSHYAPFVVQNEKKDGVAVNMPLRFLHTDAEVSQVVPSTQWNEVAVINTEAKDYFLGYSHWSAINHTTREIELYHFNGSDYRCDRLLMETARAYLLLYQNAILAHAAAIAYNGGVILFCGVPGAGKSTQAHLWEKFVLGAHAINYDKPVLFFDGDTCVASGSPWSGKESCYVNESYPIRAIVFMNKTPHNHVRQMNHAQAYSLVYPNFMAYPYRKEIAENYENLVDRIIESVPVYMADCTKTVWSVIEQLRTIFDYDQKKMEDALYMKINESFILREIAGDYVVIARGEKAFTYGSTLLLNDTAVTIWNELKKGATKQKLVEALVDAYGVSVDQATADVDGFTDALIQEGILEVE